MSMRNYQDVTLREKGCGIFHLEEKLYLLELLIIHFDYTTASSFLKLVPTLFNYGDEGEEVNPFGT